MTKRIYEFTCGDHTTDKYIDETITQIHCHCGKIAQKKISRPNFLLDGVSGDFPTALQKWEQRHSTVPRSNHEDDGF
jgi:hypothetical protein